MESRSKKFRSGVDIIDADAMLEEVVKVSPEFFKAVLKTRAQIRKLGDDGNASAVLERFYKKTIPIEYLQAVPSILNYLIFKEGLVIH